MTSCSQRLLSLEGCESLRRLVNNDKDPRRKFCLLFSLLGTLSWESRYAEPLDGDWWSVGQVCHLDIRGMTLGPASLTIGTCTSPPRLKPLLYNIASKFLEISFRVEICRDRHDRRSCKICASRVNFPGNQGDFSHNLRRTTRFTHTKCDFALKLLKIYTLS